MNWMEGYPPWRPRFLIGDGTANLASGTNTVAVAGLRPQMLGQLQGSERKKVAIATVIWHETTVSMSWIAAQLAMKSAANASQQIRRQQGREKELSRALRNWVKLSRNVA
jgi:hypothetical protein